MKKVVQDWCCLVLRYGRRLQSPEKNRRNASSEATATSTSQNEKTRNTRNRTACTGTLEKPGPKTLETQEILEQTKNLLLSRTNAYGDGCFRATRNAALLDPSKYHGLSRFPALPVNTQPVQAADDRRNGTLNGTDVQTRDCARLKHSRDLEGSQRACTCSSGLSRTGG